MKSKIKNVLLIFALTVQANAAFSFDNYEAGKRAFGNKNYQAAKTYFKKAVSKNPSNVNYRYYYAQSLIYLSKTREAQDEYEKIIELAPLSEAAQRSSVGLAKIQSYLLSQKENYKNLRTNQKFNLAQENFGDNYIDNALNSDGLLVRWNSKKMPIGVYFNTSAGITVQQYCITAIKEAFDEWAKNLSGVINYKIVTNPKEANIIILFVPEINTQKIQEGDKGFISGLATYHSHNNVLDYYDIKFLTLKPDGKSIPEAEIYNTALHEIGHALGIAGHSSNKSDIMYAINDEAKSSEKKTLSVRDINTIKILYKSEADVSNFSAEEIAQKALNKQSQTSGNKIVNLDKKLKEAEDYVKQAPSQPISWTTLGKVQYRMNNYFDAVDSFKKALSIDPKYTDARQGLAETYKDMGSTVDSIIEYRNLVSDNPKNIVYSYNLVRMYIKNNNPVQAINVINSLLTQNPAAKSDENVKELLNELNIK